MSVIRTFTITVAGGKFVIDGVSQATVTLAEGYTYKFDQSDNTNGTHPLAFATATDAAGGTQYTTGVTTNGTPGDSGAYTQITVAASAPTLYYYCTNHGGMGGQANTVDANTWNVLEWGQNSWGSQDEAIVIPTGVTATANVGSVIASADRGWGADAWSNGEWGELNDDRAVLTGLSFSADLGTLVGSSEQGWGRDEWGQEPWGESFSPTIAISSLSFSATLGTLAYAQSESGWGRDEYGVGDWGENETTVILDGLTIQTEMGPNNWGANSWGFGQYGGIFTFDIPSIIGLTGLTTTAAVGSPSTNFDFTVFPSGVTTGAGLGTLSLNNGADHTQGLASFAVPAAIGSVTAAPTTIAAITSQTITAVLSSVTPGTVELVDVNGVTFAASVGSVTVDQMAVGISSQTFASSVGSISPTPMTIGLTSQSFTASLNTVGFGILGYSDVNITGNTSFSGVDITGNTTYTDVA